MFKRHTACSSVLQVEAILLIPHFHYLQSYENTQIEKGRQALT